MEATDERRWFLFLSGDGRPGIRLHVAKRRLFPRLFGVLLEVLGREEVHAAGVTGSSRKLHLRRHLRVRSFVLHSALRAKRRLPRARTACARSARSFR